MRAILFILLFTPTILFAADHLQTLYNLTPTQRDSVKNDMRIAFEEGRMYGQLDEACKDLKDEIKESGINNQDESEELSICNNLLDFDAWFKKINVKPKRRKNEK